MKDRKDLLRSAKSLVEWNIHNPNLNVQFVARQLNVSVRSLQRAFLEGGEVTPKRWIINERVIRASNAYLSGRVTLKQLAREFGFTDVAHLSHSITKYFGVSPSRLPDTLSDT